MPYKTEAYVARLSGEELMKLETVELKDLSHGELLIEPVAASLCHTDITVASTKNFLIHQPFIPGHECSGYVNNRAAHISCLLSPGKVREVGPGVTTFKPGDAVVLSYVNCATCRFCAAGKAPYCESLLNLNWSGRRLNGEGVAVDSAGEHLNALFFGQSSLSRLIVANAAGAVKVDASPEELKLLAPLACGIQTGAGTVINIGKLPPNSSIAVWGGGAVGIAALLAMALNSPSHMILVDILDRKLQTESAQVATHRINGADLAPGETANKIMEITNGRGVDLAIDAVGNSNILREAHSALAVTGTLVTIGAPQTGSPGFEVLQHLIKGTTYRGTHQGDSVPRVFIPLMIQLWKQGKFPFDKMLSFYRFEELDKAINDMHEGNCIKPVLLFDRKES